MKRGVPGDRASTAWSEFSLHFSPGKTKTERSLLRSLKSPFSTPAASAVIALIVSSFRLNYRVQRYDSLLLLSSLLRVVVSSLVLLSL